MAQVKVQFNRGVEGTTNIVDAGTEGTRVATGTTAQRGSTAGQFRFNSSTGLAEYYDGTQFKSIDSPPSVSSISPSDLESSNLPANITITGSNFATTVSVSFIGNDGTETSAGTTTRNSTTSITAQVPNSLTSSNEPYDVKVTNTTSNLANSLADALNIDAAPVFGVASGSLGTLQFSDRSASNLTAITATDDEGDTVTFSVTSGSLPSGITLNSNGTFSGTADIVATNTTSTFTVTATDGTNTSSRGYNITVNAPNVATFNSSGTWTVPSGVTTASIVVVAGGGSGGTTDNGAQSNRGSAGGAGGVIWIPNWDCTGASSYSITVGNGGAAQSGSHNDGQNSVVSGGSKTLTALGGGAGGFSDNTDNGRSGGSAGSDWYTISGTAANAATQPANTSDGVTTYNGTGYGNPSGNATNGQPYGGGGGGAGGPGVNATDANAGNANATTTDSQGNSLTADQGNGLGGVGLYIGGTFGNSVGEQGFVASGGTGAGYNGNTVNSQSVSTKAHLGGGGIGYNASTSTPSNAQANGQANTGGGGGSGGNGGSGVVLIAY